MPTYRAMSRALRRGATHDEGALFDLLSNVKEALNELFPGLGLSLERASAPATSRIVTIAAATTLSRDTHEGGDLRPLRLTGTGSSLAQTLPAATGSGDRYKFVVGAVNTSNHVIRVTTNDIMTGNILTNSTGDTPDLAQFWPTASDSDTVTLNGTTTGGAKVGDFIEFVDIAADTWSVWGITTSSGSEATPFSAAVT